MYSLIWNTQLYQLKDADWTHYAVFYFLSVNCFGLNGNLIRMHTLEMCSMGAILMLMKADTVSTPLVRQKNISQTSSLCSRFLSQQPVSINSTKMPSSKNSEKSLAQIFATCSSPYTTQTSFWWHDFINPCLPNVTNSLKHHKHIHPASQSSKASPPVLQEQEAWGVAQQHFEVGRLKRKDLSNLDDGAEVGRRGGSVWGTRMAVNTESLGPRGTQLRARLF